MDGFRKTGLVPWNPEAVDYSKIPSVSDDPAPSSSMPSTPEEKRAGLEFLKKYIIERAKLASFRSSTDVWEGNLNDHSLLLVLKKIKEDCDNPCNSHTFGENNNIEERQDNEGEEEISMTDQCVTPKNLTGNPHVPRNTSSGGSKTSKVHNKLIPSPFKRALFWPDTTQMVEKRRSKEKIPSVVTSKQWQENHEKKEETKL